MISQLMVALDVNYASVALDLVTRLDKVTHFKIGLELIINSYTDALSVVREIHRRRNAKVMLDLKLAGDIPRTIFPVIDNCMDIGVDYLTFVEAVPNSITTEMLGIVKAHRNRKNSNLKTLFVPALSS